MPHVVACPVNPVQPALVSPCIDRLHRLSRTETSASARLMLVATCTGRDDREIAALFVRLVIAGFVCRDRRWLVWRAAATSSVETAREFEALILEHFARLPLAQSPAASVDSVFAALAARMSPRGSA